MERTTLAIDDAIFVLASEQDVEELKERIVDAARTGPAFVDFLSTAGAVSALISGRTRIALAAEVLMRADHSLAAPLELTPDGFFPYDDSLGEWVADADAGEWRG